MTQCSHVRDGKADFDHVYNRSDPRAYFKTLGQFDYQIPGHAQQVFTRVLAACARHQPGITRVLDLCCSYGINAALLNHELSLEDLYARYRSPELASMTSEEVRDADSVFFKDRRRSDAVPVIGLDVADQAATYADQVGLLEDGFAENLEDGAPSPQLAEALRDVDLLLVTGGVGYITATTFRRVLACTRGQTPWVAAFALRWVDYGSVTAALAEHGLVTETLTGYTFIQRRFVSPEERAYVLDTLVRMGIDPAGKETEGHYHADLYVSRPRRVVANNPLHELLGDLILR